MRWILIRHAQSANNALPEEQRVEDPGLTDLGRQQAMALAPRSAEFGITRLITSPFRRTLQTAASIQRQLGLPAEIRIDLHEQGGCYAGHEPGQYRGRPGMTAEDIRREFPGYRLDAAIDGGGWWKCQSYESEEQARQRARRLIRDTLAEFGGTREIVAYVMHADIIRLTLEELFGNASTRFPHRLTVVGNAAVTLLEGDGADLVCARFNCRTHLPQDIWSQ